jgi:hypothetical protein
MQRHSSVAAPLTIGLSVAYVTAKLLWGLAVRTALQSALVDGIVGACRASSRGKRKNAFLRTVTLCCCEIGVSLLFSPSCFACTLTVPRQLFHLALPGTSELLALADGYEPSLWQFLSLQTYPDDLADLTMGFMTWQIPSSLMYLGLLTYRRRLQGTFRTRTKRSLAVLALLVASRAFLTSFCVNPPETEGDAVSATVFVAISLMSQSYLARHLWPYDDH